MPSRKRKMPPARLPALEGSCRGILDANELATSVPLPIVRDRTNRPICLLKEQSNSSCISPSKVDVETRNVMRMPWREHLTPLMEDAFGGWTPGAESTFEWKASHRSFGMPNGMRYLATHSRVNNELGRDHAWIPVTRTRTQQDVAQVGLWFHYARGCSDFAWNVGRTLLVRNKCHGAIVLEQRACSCSWRVAVYRVARKLASASARLSFRKAFLLWYFADRQVSDVPLCVRELARGLDLCASGRYAEAWHGLPTLARQLALPSANAIRPTPAQRAQAMRDGSSTCQSEACHIYPNDYR